MRTGIKERFRIERQAWIRFFGGILGLAAAFGAAIFSTIERQQGNFWATAVLASAALLLAGAVGLLTVPYLARRVALARVREAFDYDITREGIVYLALILIIGIAALNTGNNLLFIIISAMLAAIVVSGIASAAVLRALELDVVLPAHVFAKTLVGARLSLRNKRRLLPTFSVSVVPPKPTKGAQRRLRFEKTIFAFPAERPPERQWLRMPDYVLRLVAEEKSERPILTTPVYFPYIRAKMTAIANVDIRFERRGRYLQDTFGLSTRFPFSFLIKTRRVELARELVVYPVVDPTDTSLEVLPMIRGEFESFMRGRGNDLYRIREYVPEDSARHVDWKATAKSGSLKVREFTREDERKLRIVFDNPGPGMLSEQAFEDAVSLTATLAWHFAGEDTELSFAAPRYGGQSDVYEFLHYLALVQPQADDSLLESLEATADFNLIVTARPRGDIPTSLWTTSYVVYINGAQQPK